MQTGRSPAESPLKLSNLSEFVQKMAQVYKKKPDSNKSSNDEMLQWNSDDATTADVPVAASRKLKWRIDNPEHQQYPPSLYEDKVRSFSSRSIKPPAASLEMNDQHSSLLSVRVRVLETLITNVFSTLSALRSSYQRLQEALSPLDVTKIEIADKAVVAEIRRLSDLRRSFLERDAIINASAVTCSDDIDEETDDDDDEHINAAAAIQKKKNKSALTQSKDVLLKSYEGIINNFHIQVRQKNLEAESLKDMLAESTLEKEKLQKKVNNLEEEIGAMKNNTSSSRHVHYPAEELKGELADVSSIGYNNSSCAAISMLDNSSPLPQLLESAVHVAAEVSKAFTNLLVSLMKAAQWDIDAACESIEVGVNYVKRSHRKFAFESYVCQQMWNGFENEEFYIFGNISSILDPEKHRRECFSEYLDMLEMDPLQLISVNPDCLFGKFCHKKFLQLVHPKMETSFFGNYEHRNQISDGGHPNSQFYQSFLKLAKSVWLVHRLAFAFSPTASIFQARRGTTFTPACMTSVVPPRCRLEGATNRSLPKVALNVMPGFRIGKIIIKCQVYLEDAGSV